MLWDVPVVDECCNCWKLHDWLTVLSKISSLQTKPTQHITLMDEVTAQDQQTS